MSVQVGRIIAYLVTLFVVAKSEDALCRDPINSSDTRCPGGAQCWDDDRTETTVVWSLYDQCATCLFPQQKSVVVQEAELVVSFVTDGSFQKDRNIEVWRVASHNLMKDCRIVDGSATLVGRISPRPVLGDTPSPTPAIGLSYSIDVRSILTSGPNFFVAFADDHVDDPSFLDSCDQGARLTVYLGQFDCGETSNMRCSNRGPCVFSSISSNFTCLCPSGYLGYACEGIDQCFNNTSCGDPLYEGFCVDEDCDFTCNCFGGRASLDGRACDVTPTNCDSNPCLNGGTCELAVGLGTVQCNCPSGFDPQRFCADFDECVSSPCYNDGMCIDGTNGYSCVCQDGFTGSNCETNKDDCGVDSCLHSGTCMDGDNDLTCNCLTPWTGKFCQIHEDDCLTAQCMNGATCIDGSMTHSCLCAGGYTGVVCESEINECVSLPCQNAGNCIDLIDGYRCECISGFTGPQCETNIDDCVSNPCYNGGTCLDHIAYYTCQCLVEFTGIQCQSSVDECLSNPCHNDGDCVELFDGFSCVCSHGYTGHLCQVDINECDSNPCQNDGTCMDLVSGYRCNCLSFYTGFQCGSRVRSCEFTVCENGGTCVSVGNNIDPVCACGWGNTGIKCEEDIDITIPAFGHPLDSYLQIRGVVVNITDQGIAIVMRATSPNGLVLLTSSTADASEDFVALHLTDGRLDYQMKIGGRMMRIVSPDAIPSCPWVTVDLRYNGELYVDDRLVARGDPPGSFSAIQQQYTYLGGVPNPEEISSATGGSASGFVGCIAALSISGNEISISLMGTDVISSQNIGQCPSNPCTNLPCSNGGACEDVGPLVTDFNCTCTDGFSGDTCEVFNPCNSELCLHGGLCQLDEESTVGYRCVCTALFIGVQCEIESQISLSSTSLGYHGDSSSVWAVNPGSLHTNFSLMLEVTPRVNGSSGILACLGEATTDFLAIVVDNGFVKVSMDLGGLRPLTLTSSTQLIADQSAVIKVQRRERALHLYVSADQAVSGSYRPNFMSLDVANRLYIAGVPSTLLGSNQKSALGVSTGFDGCIGNLFVHQQALELSDLFSSFNSAACNVDLCSSLSPCKNGGTCSAAGNSVVCRCAENYRGVTCEELFDPCLTHGCASGSTCMVVTDRAICLCPLGRLGVLCEIDVVVETPRFSDGLMSFMAFSPLPFSVRQTTLIAMSIKPESYNGLLMYADHNTVRASGDFFAIGLYDGFVEFRYNLGSGTAMIRSRDKVTLNEWHTIVAARTEQAGTLVLDDQPPVTGSSSRTAILLDVVSEVFIGGLEHYSQVSQDAGLTSGFSGCISVVNINSVGYDLGVAGSSGGTRNDGRRGHSVTDCEDHPCAGINCQNGGTCVNINELASHGCACPDGFIDDLCQTPIVSPCHQTNGGCHVDSTCVFDSALQTRSCYCPFKPEPRTGEFCNQVDPFLVPKFQGNSFLEFNVPPVDPRQTSVAFNISAQGTDGLLLLMQQTTSSSSDFLAVGLKHGHIELRLELGEGLLDVVSNINITGKPSLYHSVTIIRNSQLVTLTVDSDTVSGTTQGSHVGLNVRETFFVGGIPVMTSDLSEYKDVAGGVYSSGLIGCLNQLRVNGMLLQLATDALNGLNVASCDAS